MSGRFLHRLSIAIFFVPMFALATLAYVIAAPFIAFGMVVDGARGHWDD
ncbi:hypothetical protein [Sphingobium sp. WCS2017Hpa-17]|nr:hypothetical protein [Sphingobium sp. WCS2017Hpa-17]